MKKNIFNILSLGALLMVMTVLTSCSDEKDIVVIEDNLPIKTNVLYMVGDATPAGWNIDAPTELQRTSTYVFTYTGHLNTGELKCPLSTGDWDCTYIMPVENGCIINSGGVADPAFNVVPGGNPDNKWRVEEEGDYTLTFDLQRWTLTAVKN